MPYKKVGRNKYMRHGKVYTRRQVTAIHFAKIRRRRRGK